MQTTSRNNYYEILEVPATALPNEVSQAYERACTTYSSNNPAIYTIFSAKEADELLIMIEEAYQVLSNKVLRNIYDQRLVSGSATLEDLTYDSIVAASKHKVFNAKPQNKTPEFISNPEFEKEIAEQNNWSGEFLRKVREYKNISVEKMSEVTKINSWYITAIERVEPGSLPAVVFVRGYIIQIARALNLDDKKVADSYMKIFKSSLEK